MLVFGFLLVTPFSALFHNEPSYWFSDNMLCAESHDLAAEAGRICKRTLDVLA
jgi:hypothetical protein